MSSTDDINNYDNSKQNKQQSDSYKIYDNRS